MIKYPKIMESTEKEQFKFISSAEIKNYSKENNNTQRAFYKRGQTLEMFQLAQRRNYPMAFACSLLYQDMSDYAEIPKDNFQNFDDFLEKNKVQGRTNCEFRSTLNNPERFFRSAQQKQQFGIQETVTDDDIKAIFKSNNTLRPEKTPVYKANTLVTTEFNRFDKQTKKANDNDDDDDDEVITFNLPFNKNRKTNEQSNIEQRNEARSNQFSFQKRSPISTNSIINFKENIVNNFNVTQSSSPLGTSNVTQLSDNDNKPSIIQLPDFHKKSSSDYENRNRMNVLSSMFGSGGNQNQNKRKYQNEYNQREFNSKEIQQISSTWQPVLDQHQQDKRPTYERAFKTGLEELETRFEKKYGNDSPTMMSSSVTTCAYRNPPSYSFGGPVKKTLGGRRTVQSAYVPPFTQANRPPDSSYDSILPGNENVDERLRHIDPKIIELIRNEIMEKHPQISWDDIAGLDYAKSIIKEAVVWPILRPDIFTGLRKPPRGILLFGPPGTGKTLIGKCIASQSKSTFFSISASSLTSKWIGEGEKMVRALFAVAVAQQPSVIFIDEIDSLLCQRSETEHESSRRLKTEFLVQLDGAATSENERILIVGATNRPQELDEAARRRLVKRLYVPLPELSARIQIITNLLNSEKAFLTTEQIHEIGKLTEGFSGADMRVLCHEASMEPIRSITAHMDLDVIKEVRAINYADFRAALQCVRASVSQNDLKHYLEWDKTYGSGAGK